MRKMIFGLTALLAGAAGWVTRKWLRRKTVWIEVIDADRPDTQINNTTGKEC